jgi:hypothetical protein
MRNARHDSRHVRGETVMCPSLVGSLNNDSPPRSIEADTNDESQIPHFLSDRTARGDRPSRSTKGTLGMVFVPAQPGILQVCDPQPVK